MATKNTRGAEAEKGGVVKQARSIAGWLGQVVEWIETAPVFLKPERIQKSAVIQRPRTIEEVHSLFDWMRQIFDWIERAPAFLLDLFGLSNDNPNDNDK